MKLESEADICQAALSITDGACNLRGVAKAMGDIAGWLQDQWTEEDGYLGDVHPDKHPAIRLIMSQLGVITGAAPSGDVEGFTEALKYCTELAVIGKTAL